MNGPPANRHDAWIALALLAAINVMNYYDRLLVVVVGQPIRAEFGLSDTQYGLLTGPAFIFVYALSSVTFGWLADRTSRARLIGVAVGLWSAMTALCGMAQNFAMLALARAGIGVGEGGANPASFSLICDHFPPERRANAIALFQVGSTIGMLFSFVLASQIALAWGWRATFLLAAVPGLVLAALSLRLLHEPPRGQHDDSAARPPRGLAATLGELVANRAFVWLTAAASIGTFSSLGMVVWLPQFFIRYHGMDQSSVGLLLGPVATLGLIVGIAAGGLAGTRLARRSLVAPVWLCALSNLALAPLFVIVLWSGSQVLALVACCLAMGLAVFYAPSFQATAQTVCAPEQRGTATAFSNVLNALIGQGLLVYLIGWLSDRLAPAFGAESLRVAMTLSVATALVCGVLFLIARQHTAARFAGQASRA